MTTQLVVIGLAVGLALFGLLLVGLGLHGHVPRQAPVFRQPGLVRKLSLRGGGPEDHARRLRYAAAAAAVSVVWAVTGWPAAALLVGLGVIGVPYLFGASKQATRRIERLEALEEWTRRLADTIASGGALVQTLVRSADNAPATIAADVQVLAARLSTPRWDRAIALRRFADTFDEALADLVVVALQLAASTRGAQRVTEVLRDTAKQVSDEVAAQRAIEADRAEPRSVARNILLILAILVVAVVLAGQFTEPYDSPTGQVVLVILGAVTFGALLWMRRVQEGERAPRILADADADQSSDFARVGAR